MLLALTVREKHYRHVYRGPKTCIVLLAQAWLLHASLMLALVVAGSGCEPKFCRVPLAQVLSLHALLMPKLIAAGSDAEPKICMMPLA